MKHILTTTLAALLFSYSAKAADTVCDTIPTDSLQADTAMQLPRLARTLDDLSTSRLYRVTYIGVPLIAGGLLVKSEDDHFRSLRNDYLPRFSRHADNYLQYAPAALMLTLKATGVEGRSSWGRMLVSDATAALLMGATVNTLKQTTHVMRPDGSNAHSFPSGHTATAFMTATMLTKEYGHRSPWIGIGAYTTAAATGLMRMANNKHWLSDVMTGAGIGILSTELGYYLADLIFKERGINPDALTTADLQNDCSPSFLSLYLGINLPLSGYDIDPQTAFATASGSTTGIEGAWFATPYVGIGGRFTATTTAIIVNGNEAADNTFDHLRLAAGGYFNLPLSIRWSAGTKLLAQWTHYPRLELKDLTVGARDAIGLGTGLSLNFRATDHYNMRFFIDYDLLPSHSSGSHEYMNFLTLGGAFAISF